MKKSLVALAALAATTAFAQSSVTIYGVTDVGYTTNKEIKKADGTVVGKQKGLTEGAVAGNRVGFRGTEDLGGGLKAEFVTEMGLTVTNASLMGPRAAAAGFQYDGLATSTAKFDAGTGGSYNNNSNRQTYVGLSSPDLGTLRLGYQYTTLYEISTLSGFTQTSEGIYGGSAVHTWGTNVAGGTRSNAIDYKSPRMSGLQIGVQLGSAGGRESTEFAAANSATGLTKDNQKRTSWKLDYEQGKLKAAYAHTKYENDQSARAAGSTQNSSLSNTAIINTFNVLGGLTSVGAATVTASKFETKLDQIAASYDFGVAKVGFTRNSGTHTVISAATPAFGTAPSAANGGAVGDYKFKSQAVSAIAPFGKVRLMAGMGTAEWSSSSATNADLKQQQIGVLYDFSKRTTAYLYNGSFKDEKATTGNYKGTQTIAGLVHSF